MMVLAPLVQLFLVDINEGEDVGEEQGGKRRSSHTQLGGVVYVFSVGTIVSSRLNVPDSHTLRASASAVSMVATSKPLTSLLPTTTL